MRQSVYKVIDLFAGAGGLSLGFVQAGEFEIAVAAEIDTCARKTYLRNHPHVECYEDVHTIDYQAILQKHGSIDVVIGGPPCQGFSNANRQKNRLISTNNDLVKEYVRAIHELNPTIFVMENVAMLGSNVQRFFVSSHDDIENLEIKIQQQHLALFPPCLQEPWQYEELIDLFCTRRYRLWNEDIYSLLNIIYKRRDNPSKLRVSIDKHVHKIKRFAETIISQYVHPLSFVQNLEILMSRNIIKMFMDGTIEAKDFIDIIRIPLLIQKFWLYMEELRDKHILVHTYDTIKGVSATVSSYSVIDYITKRLQQAPYNYTIESKVLNAVDYDVPQKRQRYIMLGVKHKFQIHPSFPVPMLQRSQHHTVGDAIGDLVDIQPSINISDPPKMLPVLTSDATTLFSKLRDTDILHNHVTTNTQPTAKQRFTALKQGQNFHDLSDDMKQTYSDSSRTQNTIYLRLKNDEPSDTVVNVRKSMWIHPSHDRALSIREAARLQTFPDSFIFEGTKDKQYQQIGNAVPPLFALAIARQVLEILNTINSKNF